MKSSIIWIVTAIEGMTVMALEILSARMISPVFGSSLLSWTFVLSTTLFGLALGYYMGGMVAKKFMAKITISLLLRTGAGILATLPILATLVLGSAMYLGFYAGLLLSCLVIILPSMTLLGTISPVLVHTANQTIQVTGEASGKIFGLSTLGGIFGALFFGLVMLPQVGITASLYVLAVLLLAASFLFKRTNKLKGGLVVGLVVFGSMTYSAKNLKGKSRNTLHNANTLLGQVKVVQDNFKLHGKSTTLRMQMINNTLQGILDVNNPGKNLIDYQKVLNPTLNQLYKKGNFLILGLGSGLIYNHVGYHNTNIQFDFVEFDEEIVTTAKDYFLMPSQGNLSIELDDARHYLNTSKKMYDMILVDTFSGESIPSHVLTIESLEGIKTRLNENGLLVINFHGYFEGEKGKAARSLVHTLRESGYNIKVAATDEKDGIERSLLMFCSLQDLAHLDNLSIPSFEKGEAVKPLSAFWVDEKKGVHNDVVLLTDNQQQLEHLLRDVCLDWRRYVIKTFVQPQHKQGDQLFD